MAATTVEPGTRADDATFGQGGAIDRVVDFAYWQLMVPEQLQDCAEVVCELIDRIRARWADISLAPHRQLAE